MSLWFWKVLHKGDVLLGICALLNNAFESTTNMFLFALWPLIKQLCTGKSSINVLWCYPRKGLANNHARIIIKVSLPQHSASRSRLQCLYIYEVSSDFSTQNIQNVIHKKRRGRVIFMILNKPIYKFNFLTLVLIRLWKRLSFLFCTVLKNRLLNLLGAINSDISGTAFMKVNSDLFSFIFILIG